SHSTSTLLPFLYSTGPPPTEISTLSLHDALPISGRLPASGRHLEGTRLAPALPDRSANHDPRRFRPGKAGGRAGHGPRAAQAPGQAGGQHHRAGGSPGAVRHPGDRSRGLTANRPARDLPAALSGGSHGGSAGFPDPPGPEGPAR